MVILSYQRKDIYRWFYKHLWPQNANNNFLSKSTLVCLLLLQRNENIVVFKMVSLVESMSFLALVCYKHFLIIQLTKEETLVEHSIEMLHSFWFRFLHNNLERFTLETLLIIFIIRQQWQLNGRTLNLSLARVKVKLPTGTGRENGKNVA